MEEAPRGRILDRNGRVLVDNTVVDVVTIESPTQGWAADLYVATEVPDSRAGWGAALVTQSGINGSLRAELGGSSARAVLIWITDLGDGPAPVRAEINEITLFPG